MANHEEKFKKRELRLEVRLIAPVVAIMIVLLAGAVAARADDQEALDKLGKFLGQVKKYVDTLTDDEMGEKQLLEYMAAKAKTHESISDLCLETVNSRNADSVTEKWNLLFSGYIPGMDAKELVGLVKDKLENDGFIYVEETDSGGEKSIRFFNESSDRQRKKSYLLVIHQGWWQKTMNYFRGIDSKAVFCLIKIEKV